VADGIVKIGDEITALVDYKEEGHTGKPYCYTSFTQRPQGDNRRSCQAGRVAGIC
jgi:hypothetical protein